MIFAENPQQNLYILEEHNLLIMLIFGIFDLIKDNKITNLL